MLAPRAAFVWAAPCNPNGFGISGYPRNVGEGFLCYILRVLAILGWINGGLYNSATAYSQNTMVSLGASLYLALQPVPAGITPGTNPAYWELLLTAPAGPPGPAGSAATPTRAVRAVSSSATVGNTDDLIYAAMTSSASATITLSAYSSYSNGKAVTIDSSGLNNVTIATTGGDTIILPSTGAAVSTMIIYGVSSINLVSLNTGVWSVV